MSQRNIGGIVYNPPAGWSAQFNGSNYLQLPTSSALVIGQSLEPFCIEAWIYQTVARNCIIIGAGTGAVAWGGNFYRCALGSNASVGMEYKAGTSQGLGSSANVFTLNSWTHVAWTSDGTTLRVFANGAIVASAAVQAFVSPGTLFTRIGRNTDGYDSGEPFTGYISNLRVVKGSAVYTSAFTPPTGALLPITNTSFLSCRYPTIVDGSTNAFTITNSGTVSVATTNPFPTSALPNPALGNAGNGIYTMSQYAALLGAGTWPAYDPYYKNVTLNLHGNGTNAAQNNTFLDSSTNNFTITRNGNTTQGTFSPYGPNWSNYFDGVSDYLSIADNAAFDLGTGDFTLETWVYHTTTSGTLQVYYSHRTNGLALTRNTSGYLEVAQDAVAVLLTSITTVPSNQWVHVATSRSGTSLKLFINGVVSGSTVNSTSLTSSNPVYIGSDYSSAYEFTGYISNMRLIKGTAIYTDSFTPPTAPLTAITNTSLLTCQSNRFIDNSTNNFTITKNGDVSVQRFSPFSPTTAYSTSVIGGSGYFDGSGDYLRITSATALTLGSGDFCIEMWIYPTAGGSNPLIWGEGPDVGSNNMNIHYNISGNGTIQVYIDAFSGSSVMQSSAISQNTWTHVAVTRSGSTFRLFINGTQSSTYSNAGSVNSGDLRIGASYVGYICDSRTIKGSAVYTSAFTPPTAPLTAITNTSLLLSYTNAGILDNAMMNDLETVGNAQISTSVKKYGTGSMYFDGTGDWLACPPEPVQFGAGSFTIEAWVYPTASRYNPIITRNWTGNNKLILAITSSGAVDVWVGHATSGYYQGTSSAVCSTLNTWYHIALVRNGSTITCYVNGSSVLTGSCTATMTDSNTNLMYIGYYLGDGSTFQGYIDDLRITKGVARYTTTFTPPTSQVQDQ